MNYLDFQKKYMTGEGREQTFILYGTSQELVVPVRICRGGLGDLMRDYFEHLQITKKRDDEWELTEQKMREILNQFVMEWYP